MSIGKSVASFCVRAEISRPTFNLWCSANPEFGEAYEIAKQFGVEWWENWAEDRIDDPGFNMAFFKATMISRYDVCYEKKLKVKDFDLAKTTSQKMEKVAEVLAEGNHDAKTAKAIADIVAIIASVEEKTETIKRLEALELQQGYKP